MKLDAIKTVMEMLIRTGKQDETIEAQLSEITADHKKTSLLINNIDKIAETLSAAVTGDDHLLSMATGTGQVWIATKRRIQATATGRRKFGTKGKGPVQPGSPRQNKLATTWK